MNKIKKLRREQKIVGEMIGIYCRKNHGSPKGSGLCGDCRELLEYSILRSERCPFRESKTFCSNCRVHCYQPEMRTKIRQVMRFSGPRMIFYHSCMAIWHVVCSIKEKNGEKTKYDKD